MDILLIFVAYVRSLVEWMRVPPVILSVAPVWIIKQNVIILTYKLRFYGLSLRNACWLEEFQTGSGTFYDSLDSELQWRRFKQFALYYFFETRQWIKSSNTVRQENGKLIANLNIRNLVLFNSLLT